MDTIELTLHAEGSDQELLIAELADLDFDAFEQDAHVVKAYTPASQWTDTKRAHLEAWLRAQGLNPRIDERRLTPQNWNELWEASLEPIAVGSFLIKPTWAAVQPEHAEAIVLDIVPKMSFGTGYHETTRLVLHFLEKFVEPGAYVLDAGTGTGILAIAAVKLGAAEVIAFDVDPWSQQNAEENMQQNGVEEQVTFRLGSLDSVPESGFDVILANINRNVLEAMLPDFKAKLNTGGRLVLAGLLQQDRDAMLARAEAEGFRMVEEAHEHDWWAVVLTHQPEPIR